MIAIYITWGSTYLGIAIAIKTVPPFLMSSVRFLIAGALMYAWCRWRGVGAKISWRELGACFVVGTGLAIGNGGVVWGEQYIPTGIASILVATSPFWMVLMTRIAFRDQVRPLVWIGLAVGFAGLVLLVAPISGGSLKVVGVVSLLCASLGWAAGSVFSRSVALPSSPQLSTALQMVAIAVVLGIASAISGEPAQLRVQSVSGQSVAAFVYLIIFGSLVGFTCYTWLLQVAPISMVSTYAYINPVVAVVLGWIVLQEQISLRTVFAGAIVLLGVALILLGRVQTVDQEATALPVSPLR